MKPIHYAMIAFASVMISTPLASAKDGPSPLQATDSVQFHIEGEMTSVYGTVKDPVKNGTLRNHRGVDFKAPTGTPIYAPTDGVIISASNMGKYGKVVIFQTSDGTQTLLAHLDSYAVRAGEQILKGQKIAEIGNTGQSTGSHVHIETRQNGVRVNPAIVWDFAKP